MTTTTIPASLADIYLKAADHIERVGWTQGYLYDEKQARGTDPAECRVCTIGAINVAVFGSPNFSAYETAASDASSKAEQFLEVHLGLTATGVSIADWNDDGDRTATQVTTALRNAAEAAKKEAA